ncbi:MAG: DUF3800 domain-containing protein [Campylobacterales bacterium]|nr:DUF3800 domain-containing protein [Campylobacterales bacterium]
MSNYKIFCDESCHLQNDSWDIMSLGAVKLPADEYEKIKNDIKEIKLKHKNPFEIKWTKLSYSRMPLYKELIDYFIDSHMSFRVVTIINKQDLNHNAFNQTHSQFYYKTYYLVLKKIMNENDKYQVYMDLKDTRGKEALINLIEVFQKSHELPTPFMQHIRADESQLLQLTDLFTGAVSYKMRNLKGSKIKLEIIEYIEKRLSIQLNTTSSYGYEKFNRFIQDPKKVK